MLLVCNGDGGRGGDVAGQRNSGGPRQRAPA
jgi:hypothetical protein